MNRFSVLLIGVVLALTGCKKLTDPAPQNNGDFENIYDEPSLAHGLLLNGYTRLPTNGWTFSDVATDDAVSNDATNNFRRVATGQWSSVLNPLDQWTNSRAGIQYLNMFLAEADKVNWDTKDPMLATMFKDRLTGEAYGLRAYLMFYMLQAHAGWVNGVLYGFPLVLDPETPTSDFNKPRATFDECMQQIYSDLAKAEELLPLDYNDISSASQVPAKYAGVKTENYNRVFGRLFKLRMTARIAKAIRAKAALLAASPAYSTANNPDRWVEAANRAGEVLQLNGWLTNLDPEGVTWYNNKAEIDALASGAIPKEILWRTNIGSNSDLEADHYPPTLFGNGRLNPTQNLVDAFPMANGYPIRDAASSGYSSGTPYANRDPRLAKYIVYNGEIAGPTNAVINTSADGLTNDALNRVETSTRTGYYMRKLLRQDVSRNSASINNQKHYRPHIRYTEIFLAYAEAANEAWGPTGTGGNANSAYDIIKALRNRAGVGRTNGDAYLESVKNDKDAMRTLIRNERRLELAFEGFRFWDLRRWNQDLNETAKGVRIQQNVHQVIDVEARSYQDFMRFGPIPYSEVLKFNALQQNTGW
ncbi:putative outer membrane starch-binding protein [Arcticibacter pallidicorallinus]|uniref:Putative outer membrane starch-binding protein n=1 Tax=Arcticibacter pallidicorallinus TaxID=1259464 RepID=A0A2T0UC64_9SPHI|nr:RagB/SusD family nutrient uptake outer membrane protein [Arcticibacter pallidicorallinus]PRY55530.1 putative outer membrane starch-binding protein [Arcticibacter pallidicorallinus]